MKLFLSRIYSKAWGYTQNPRHILEENNHEKAGIQSKLWIFKSKCLQRSWIQFIRCHEIDTNWEYINILQQDGTIQEGIFRSRHDGGNTSMVSWYFRRSGREEDRIYGIYITSGEIIYQDTIFWGKNNSSSRTLAWYYFNPETLDWTKGVV